MPRSGKSREHDEREQIGEQHAAEVSVRRTGHGVDRSDTDATEARLRFQAQLLDAVEEAIIATDPQGTVTYWNRHAEVLYGWSADEAIGRNITELTPATNLVAEANAVMERLRAGMSWRGEFLVRRKDGSEFPALVIDSPIFDDAGQLIGIVGTSIDITDRKRAADQQRFLAEMSSILASSFDYRATLGRIADRAVPFIADLFLVDLRSDDGSVARVAVGFGGEDADRIVAEAERFSANFSWSPLARAIESGEPILIPHVDDAWIRSIARGPEHVALIERLAPRSAIVAPLVARGRAYGVITAARTDPAREFDEVDLALVAEMARRIGLAVDNARLYEAALVANEAKSDFLAVISHELRTPLNSIFGYADLLRAEIAGPLTAKQREHLTRVDASARRLLELIDEVLTFTRLDAGRERIGFERIDLRDLLRRAAVVVEAAARDKGLTLDLHLPAEPVMIETDPAKVRQICLNLLGNAVKFTEAGGITVDACVGNGTFSIQVHDTGVGIAPSVHERIFDPFWQVEKATIRTAGGAGLGLSVSRRLARLLGGDILVRSTPGQGSTFTVRLPMHPVPEGRGNA